MKIDTPTPQQWQELISKNPSGGNMLQSVEFAELKRLAGWKPQYITDSKNSYSYAVLEKSIPLLGKVWYCPKGPGVTTAKQLESFLPELTKAAKKHGAFICKIEPDILLSYQDKLPQNLHKTIPVQYNFATIFVDLTPNLDEILMKLPQKGRHAIRRGERDGVMVKKVAASEENMRTMYQLLRETSQGAGFSIRPYEYYQMFWQAFDDSGQLFFAYHNKQLIAGAFAVVYGKKSTYKDGASVRERPVYGASHLLQWEVMKWAKSRGSTEHDLGGTPPQASIHDKTHPRYGIGRFKLSFNKEVTEYVGAYDVSIRPVRAWLWQHGVEKLVRKVYFIRNKQSFY